MNELRIVKADTLPIEQRQFIDGRINQIIQQHKNNRGEINRLTFDCMTSLTAGQARSAELAGQGFFDRLLGGITGKNQYLQSEIDRNYAAAQYASQMCLQKLAENNLMTFELVAAVNNKLNSFAVNVSAELNAVNREINNIYDLMGKFFRQIRSDILQLEQRVDRLEQNVKLLNWKNSIEYQSFEGVEYEALSTVGKIVCMTKDFYEITKGNWTTSDLLLLKAALAEADLPPKSKITYLDFLNGLIDEPKFLAKLLDGIHLENVDAVYTTILETVNKYQMLEGDEKYLVDVISEFMIDQRVDVNLHKLKIGLVAKYIDNIASVSLSTEIPIYEFCLELIYNFEQVEKNIWSPFNQEEIDKAEELGKRGDIYKHKSLFDKLLQEGWGRAAYYLALVSSDKKEILDKGVELGDVLCKSYRFRFYGGEFTKEDYNSVYNEAVNGDYVAQNELCWLMLRGDIGIVEKNEYEAIHNWLRKSAEQGYSDSQNDLANQYYNGNHGLEQNYEEAIKWYRLAAEQNFAKSQYQLANCYKDSDGIEQNYKEAVKWFRKAAEQGLDSAQYNLGLCYKQGDGVTQDYDEAWKWYHQSAAQGYKRAIEALTELNQLMKAM